jgi:6-phosphogluconolactonase (cycloisomerase 2 family)
VPDKGLDLVHVFTLDTATGKLVANTPPSVAARSGSAPRHVVLHPAGRYAHVVNELDSTVTTYRFDEDRGTLEPIQVIPTIPTTFTGNNTGAEIAVTRSGRFVYASNRGHNSIAMFAVEKSGALFHVGWESTLGRTPRFIALDPSENFLYAANQGSNNIVAFRVNQSSGALSPTGYVVEVGTPTCVVFATPGTV